jgi:hypothetical protein
MLIIKKFMLLNVFNHQCKFLDLLYERTATACGQHFEASHLNFERRVYERIRSHRS